MAPSWDAIEEACPVRAGHAALVEATKMMGLVGGAYHTPHAFLPLLNALVQALRNVTFRLQNEKARVPGFEAWYAEEQAKLRAVPSLRGLVAARNKVVHEAGLASKSGFRCGVFRGRRLRLAADVRSPLMTDSNDLLLQLQLSSFGALVMDPGRSSLGEQLGVERTWVIEDLGDTEVLALTVEILNNLGALITKAHARCLSSFECEPIIADDWDRQAYQVLLETDVEPSLARKWGWDKAEAQLKRYLGRHEQVDDE